MPDYFACIELGADAGPERLEMLDEAMWNIDFMTDAPDCGVCMPGGTYFWESVEERNIEEMRDLVVVAVKMVWNHFVVVVAEAWNWSHDSHVDAGSR
jgi:hypothetical protein